MTAGEGERLTFVDGNVATEPTTEELALVTDEISLPVSMSVEVGDVVNAVDDEDGEDDED